LRSETREAAAHFAVLNVVCLRQLTGMTNPTPLYIACSPRPRVGKTVLARLLMEFLRVNGRPLVGYDLHPREPGLAGYFPHLVSVVDLAETAGQMALFDRLIADQLRTKVVDLGYGQFDRFFDVMWEIGFILEARRRLIEPVILFVADPAPATIRAYAGLRRRFAQTAIVPVHNESVSIMFSEQNYPPTRAECKTLVIPRLSPIVKGVIDRPSFSFADYIGNRPGGPTEVHAWIERIFVEIRELELQLMLGRLHSSLAEPRRRA
jgi:hypothetical protein